MSESIRDAVMATVSDKIQAGEKLEQAMQHEAEALGLLAQAQQASAQARKDALKAGWDERSLRRLGLLGSPRKTNGRQDKQRREPIPESPQT